MQQERRTSAKVVEGMGDIVLMFFIVQLFQGHYFSPLFLFCAASYDFLCPMIFCDSGAGKSAFLAADRRSQL